MTNYNRYKRLDPETNRKQLVQIRESLSKSIFTGEEPVVMIDPVPAEALHTDVYAANGKTRRESAMENGPVAHGSVDTTVVGVQSVPATMEFKPKTPIGTP